MKKVYMNIFVMRFYVCNEILCVSNLKEGVNYMEEYVKIVLGLEDGKTVS